MSTKGITVHEDGSITIYGREALEFARFLAVRSSISLYLRTGLLPTRGFNAARMREAASRYTGKVYARSRKGLETALADLDAMKANAEAPKEAN